MLILSAMLFLTEHIAVGMINAMVAECECGVGVSGGRVAHTGTLVVKVHPLRHTSPSGTRYTVTSGPVQIIQLLSDFKQE